VSSGTHAQRQLQSRVKAHPARHQEQLGEAAISKAPAMTAQSKGQWLVIIPEDYPGYEEPQPNLLLAVSRAHFRTGPNGSAGRYTDIEASKTKGLCRMWTVRRSDRPASGEGQEGRTSVRLTPRHHRIASPRAFGPVKAGVNKDREKVEVFQFLSTQADYFSGDRRHESMLFHTEAHSSVQRPVRGQH